MEPYNTDKTTTTTTTTTTTVALLLLLVVDVVVAGVCIGIRHGGGALQCNSVSPSVG